MMSKAYLANLLRNFPFFRDVDYPLQDLAGKMSIARFHRGENIFNKGEDGNYLYLIISGRVLIYSMSATGQEVVIQTLEKSDFFGEMSLLDGGKRFAGARAVEETIVFCLERKDLLDIIHKYPQVALIINETLSKRLRLANARIKVLPGAGSIATVQQPETAGADEKTVEQPDQSPAAGQQPVCEDELNQDIEKTLYHAKITCPVCATKFESMRVRSGSIRVQRIDNDFCQHYQSANPLYYEMMVCPRCGFAFNLDFSKMRMSAGQREEVKLRLQPVWQDRAKNYGGVRTWNDAMEAFQLALYALEGGLVKSSKMGMLYLKTAWLYRYEGNGAGEQKYIQKAISSFAKAYETESFSDPKSELNIIYLLGALNMRAGKIQESAKWLDLVLRHPAKSMMPMLVNQTKDLWAEVRQKLREEKQA